MIGDGRALVVGYESATLDTTREIQFNKLSMGNAGTTEAVMHRLLRKGKPWHFDLEGVSEEAYGETENRYVSYQLSKTFEDKWWRSTMDTGANRTNALECDRSNL